MTIDANTEPRRLLRPVALVVAATVAIALAGVTAQVALAGPSSPTYLTAARSVDVLQAAFGAVAEKPIREPRVVVAPTSATISALSDDVNIANRAWNPRTGRLWLPLTPRPCGPEAWVVSPTRPPVPSESWPLSGRTLSPRPRTQPPPTTWPAPWLWSRPSES